MFPNDAKANEIREIGDVIVFGQYALNMEQRTFARNGQRISLKPKTFEVLNVLLQHENRAVSKDEIIQAVWHDSFVEEGNLAVHISTLRKIFSANGDRSIYIETVAKMGYRLVTEPTYRVNGGDAVFVNGNDRAEIQTKSPLQSITSSLAGKTQSTRGWTLFCLGLIAGLLTAGFGAYNLVGTDSAQTGIVEKPRKHHSFKTPQCPREAPKSNLIAGGCEEAVASFNLVSNPNGNWSYGYTSKDDTSNFVLFREPVHNNHFYAPEVPSDLWRRPEEWQPSILRNTSPMTVVIQDGVVVPPHMFEMHPGPNGERSVLRWTAPVDGHFLVQGQFRGINTNGDTTTDVLVVFNGKEIHFSDNVTEYNLERPFEVTVKALAGETVDLSVGYGSNEAYECDSTGVSVLVSTISLANRADP